MSLKNFKPITPGQRGLVLTDKNDLYKGKPFKVWLKALNLMVVEIIMVT